MPKLTLLFLVFFVSSGIITGQTTERGKITGKIIDEQQKTIEGATAELLRGKDSSLVKVAISNRSGIIEFENIRFGFYFIRITHVNHERYFSS